MGGPAGPRPCTHCRDSWGRGVGRPWPACSELASSLPQYIFADAYAQYLWITFDLCNTIQGFSIPFRAADLLLHSKASNLLLGFDRSHPNKQVRELLEHSQVGLLRFSVLPQGVVCPLSDLPRPLPPPFPSLAFVLVDVPWLRKTVSPWRPPSASQPGGNAKRSAGPRSQTSCPCQCRCSFVGSGGTSKLWKLIRQSQLKKSGV